MLRDDTLTTIECPAKINLSLAILGRRADGFHDLHSVVAQTGLSDRLELKWVAAGQPEEDHVLVEGAELPADNTVATALRLFREASGLVDGAFKVRLLKEIPSGAGLGGGSSDAVGVLRALQELAQDDLPALDWMGLARTIGSDCPLFLIEEPVIMEGRGERIQPLKAKLAQRFRGRPLILFKPRFSINTGEAYRRFAAGAYYRPAGQVEAAMQAWEQGDAPLPPPGNDFERLVEDWIPSLAVLLDRLRRVHGLDVRMSGSGSACFVFPNDPGFAKRVVMKELSLAFSDQFWMRETVFN